MYVCYTLIKYQLSVISYLDAQTYDHRPTPATLIGVKRRRMHVGYEKSRTFRLLSCFLSETIQDRAIVWHNYYGTRIETRAQHSTIYRMVTARILLT